MTLKEEIIDILQKKNNEISLQIIEVIDIFDEPELLELKAILSQEDPEKLKEALIYKHSLFQKTMDKIISLQKEFHQIKSECDEKKKKQENSNLDNELDNLLDTI
jgi:hypothetical protein